MQVTLAGGHRRVGGLWLRLARGIAWLTNPCLLSIAVLLAAVATEADVLAAALPGLAAVVACLVVLPLAYTHVRMRASYIAGRRPGDLIDFLKGHPGDVMVLGVVAGGPLLVSLALLEAGELVVGTVAALLLSSLLVALLRRLVLPVSYHLAGVACLVIMSALLWAVSFPATAAVVPLVIWAKHALGEHTFGQMLAGLLVGALASAVTLWLIGVSVL